MLLKINSEQLNKTIASIGAHPASLLIFENKAEIIPFKLIDVRTPAANVIKQEMLACGGDAVTPVSTILNKDKYVDVLLLGTRKHYNILIKKLETMGFFGMSAIAQELTAALHPEALCTKLADGRIFTYEKMRVMGILNVTPDSFYSGSRVDIDSIVKKAGEMLSAGADILDIGGESTRPGSDSVTQEEEARRVLPAIEAIRKAYPQAIISIDTYRSEVAEAAVMRGADIINDISAMENDKNMLKTVIRMNAPIILMHMKGNPKNMQDNCEYKDVVSEVATYLNNRANLLREKGIGPDKIILDPGIGFAKNVEQNLLLMRDIKTLTSFGYPVLLACSRKSTIGKVLGDIPAEARLAGTIATSCQAVYAGVQLVRVHDVKENVEAIRMLEAIKCARNY
ncbi:MAG: dihydropteroate synthase [Phascolarctobacterium sp.]|nr:dihydropteroate synthase [Phascolarctobacterium sp.]